MLARLLRTVLVVILLAAAAWALVQWRAGRPGLALVGALALLFSYTAFLALECWIGAWYNRHDPAPRASLGDWLRAFAGELLWAPLVFCWRQPFGATRWPDHLPPDAHGRRGLVLVHGFFCNRGLWNRWYPRLRALGVPHVAVNLEPVFGSIDNYVAVIEAAVRRVEAATGLAPVLVAHSMGGLAVRRWAVEPGHLARLHHVVTIGSPHHGTALARFAFSPNTRQMQRGNAWLTALMRHEAQQAAHHEAGVGLAGRSTCFFGHCDHIVFPASTAVLPGAQGVHLRAVAHVHMADRPEPLAEVLQRLGADEPRSAARPPVTG